jgi:puromycin-sensitive aminopeptidase
VGGGSLGLDPGRLPPTPTHREHTMSDQPIDDGVRLPRTVVPERYELVLTPDLDAASFVGTVDIDVEVVESTRSVVCHAAELAITEAWLTSPSGERKEPSGIELDEAAETLELAFPRALEAGTGWSLHIAFSGVLNDKLRGFYRSTFSGPDGTEHTIATTQFEATDARRAFPCWDEPDRKAVFAVTLVVPDGLLAVSNAGERSREQLDDDTVAVHFVDSARMSTYLVAFVVGPLEVTEAVDAGGVALRIVHPPGKGHLTAYALEVGAFCLQFFADYYEVPYPGDKLDLVAIPDFAFGAMENLGCVTFREVLLLVDPDEATQPELERVTDVIAHELAHMWFGDLVTMKWWNGIWLNEAFATFMELLACDAFRPDWDRWTSFGLSRTAAFDVDALRSTRPVEYPVVTPADAEGMFDLLTYEKGAAVLRMLEQYLGAEVFRDGIRRYLATHAFGNTETTDLWDSLDEVTDEPVRQIMDSWIFQGGFPLVHADLIDDGNVLRLSQDHFGYAGDRGEGDDESGDQLEAQRWIVPVLVTLAGGGAVTVERVLLDGASVDVPLVEPVEWLFTNTEGTGYYRTAHATALLDGLVSRAQRVLSPIERYLLVDDAWSAVLADAMPAHHFVELTEHFGHETDRSVWQRILASLRFLDRMVDDDTRAVLRTRVATLAGPALERLGDEPGVEEPDRVRSLRGELFEALGTIGEDPAVRIRARQLHDDERSAPGTVDPELLAASIRVIAWTGGAAEFDDFLARFQAASSPQEERRYLDVLADFDEAEILERLLPLTLDGTIRPQDAPYLVRRALANRHQGPRAWAFVREQWSTINERFPSNSIARMLEGVRWLIDEAAADDVFAFFATHQVPQGDRIVAQHLERLEVNLALRHRASEALARHLS